MRALCPEAQHPGAAQGLHRAAVHRTAREAMAFLREYFEKLEKVKIKGGARELTLTVVKCKAGEGR